MNEFKKSALPLHTTRRYPIATHDQTIWYRDLELHHLKKWVLILLGMYHRKHNQSNDYQQLPQVNDASMRLVVTILSGSKLLPCDVILRYLCDVRGLIFHTVCLNFSHAFVPLYDFAVPTRQNGARHIPDTAAKTIWALDSSHHRTVVKPFLMRGFIFSPDAVNPFL